MNDSLSHFGVKGMKWGHRKARSSTSSRQKRRNRLNVAKDILIDERIQNELQWMDRFGRPPTAAERLERSNRYGSAPLPPILRNISATSSVSSLTSKNNASSINNGASYVKNVIDKARGKKVSPSSSKVQRGIDFAKAILLDPRVEDTMNRGNWKNNPVFTSPRERAKKYGKHNI